MPQPKRTLSANVEPPSKQHAAALHGNDPTAWQHIRANSGHSPDVWDEIDRAFWQGFRSAPSANAADATANAATLQFDEWEDRDDMLVEETSFARTAIDDLQQAGLVRDTSLARLVSVWQTENKFDEVERSMDARSVSVEDRTVTEINGVPLPLSHIDIEIGWREQQNSEAFGEDLETADVRKAGRALREDLEDLVFNGWGNSVQTRRGSFSLEGYTNFPDRLTANGSDWGVAQNVIDDVRAALNELEQQGDNNNEGYMPEELGAWLYVPTAHWGDLTRQSDPEGDGNMNLLTRIEQDFPYLDIRHAGARDSDEFVMVVQDMDVVDLADAQAPTTQSWDIEGGYATRFKSLACQVPRLKSTRAGRSGIVHFTGIDG